MPAITITSFHRLPLDSASLATKHAPAYFVMPAPDFLKTPSCRAPLAKRPVSVWLVVGPLACVGAFGVLDYLARYGGTFFPFYAFPILFVLWFRSRAEAIAVAFLSTGAWWIADRLTGHLYSSGWHHAFDTLECLLFFLLIVAAAAFHQDREASRSRIALLEHSHRLEQEIIQISEQERQRIGRDLHDDLGQHLVAISFAVDALARTLEQTSLSAAREMQAIAGLVRDAIVRARGLAHGLSPVDTDDGGLEMALEQLTASIQRLSGIPCSFIADGAISTQEPTHALHLYRIAQEAINNALKHARPTRIVVALDTEADRLSLRISDDGHGFPSEPTGREGMGLGIMQYRARTLGGTLRIEGNPPRGTVITCTIDPRSSAPSPGNAPPLYD